MDGQTHREVDRWTDTQRGGQMDGQTHREVDRWMDTQRGGQMDGQTHRFGNRVMDIQWVRGGQMTDRGGQMRTDGGGQMDGLRWTDRKLDRWMARGGRRENRTDGPRWMDREVDRRMVREVDRQRTDREADSPTHWCGEPAVPVTSAAG